MTIYFAGSETECLTPVSGLAPDVTTNAFVAVANVNRAGFLMYNSSAVAHAVFPSALTEGWIHFRIVRVGTQGTSEARARMFGVENAEGQSLLNLWGSFAITEIFYSLLAGSQVATGVSSLEVDIFFSLSPTTGILRLYLNQNLVSEVLGNVQFPSGTQAVSHLYFSGANINIFNPTGACQAHYGQVMVTSTPTIGAKLHTLPGSAGSVNDWVGTLSSVTGTTSAGNISEDTINGEVSLALANFGVSIQSGFRVEAVVLSSRAQAIAGSVVTRLQGRARVGGTSYDAGGLKLLASGFAPVQHVMATNPATGLGWTSAEVDAAEFGLQAKA